MGELPVTARIALLAIQLGAILFAANAGGRLARRLKMPAVLGELAAGIAIGPWLLGGIALPAVGLSNGLFPLLDGSPLPVSLPLYALAALGSAVLLFMSGLETDLRMFFRYSAAGIAAGTGGAVLSFTFGAGFGAFLLSAPFFDPRCLFLGILCSATSVGISARILSEKKSVDTPEGSAILAAAVFDDILAIAGLAAAMGAAGASFSGGSMDWKQLWISVFTAAAAGFGVAALWILLARRIAKLLKKTGPPAVFSILALALALLISGIFELAGLALIVGAYAAGLGFSGTDIAFQVRRSLSGIRELLVPVFFAVTGMLVDVRVLAEPEVLQFGLLFGALAILAKLIGCALPALFMNFNLTGALRIGAGMTPRGEVTLIIAGAGATATMNSGGAAIPVLNSELFGMAVIMTLVSMLAAPPLLSAALAVEGKGVRRDRGRRAGMRTGYVLPSELMADFALRKLSAYFQAEGFCHSELAAESGLTCFRRENEAFTLTVNGSRLDFESGESEIPLIKTAMHEISVEIYRCLEDFRHMAEPGDFENAVIGDMTESRASGTVRADKIIAAVLTELNASTQEEAIRELVEALRKSGRLTDAELCLKDALQREASSSGCLSSGVALPHARTAGTAGLVAAVGVSRKGYREFGTIGSTVRIAVLTLAPAAGSGPYLHFISGIAGILADPENLRELTGTDATPDFIISRLNEEFNHKKVNHD